MPSQVPLPASCVATPSPPSSPPAWRTERSAKVEDDSDYENEVVTHLLTEDFADISLCVEPSHTPAPSTALPTPSSIALSLPSTYVSPNEESEYSDSEFQKHPELCHSEWKRKTTTKLTGGADSNFIASEKDLEDIDEAYNEYSCMSLLQHCMENLTPTVKQHIWITLIHPCGLRPSKPKLSSSPSRTTEHGRSSHNQRERKLCPANGYGA